MAARLKRGTNPGTSRIMLSQPKAFGTYRLRTIPRCLQRFVNLIKSLMLPRNKRKHHPRYNSKNCRNWRWNKLSPPKYESKEIKDAEDRQQYPNCYRASSVKKTPSQCADEQHEYWEEEKMAEGNTIVARCCLSKSLTDCEPPKHNS